jgi:hypothetical protein
MGRRFKASEIFSLTVTEKRESENKIIDSERLPLFPSVWRTLRSADTKPNIAE